MTQQYKTSKTKGPHSVTFCSSALLFGAPKRIGNEVEERTKEGRKVPFGKRPQTNPSDELNLRYGRPADILAPKHESRILKQSSNPVCGSWKSQVSSPWAKQHCSIMEKPHTEIGVSENAAGML